MYLINQKGVERAKALVRAGKYTGAAWSFSASDSNALLGETPSNWTEYRCWFFGTTPSLPDSASETTGKIPTKEDYAYPFGKEGMVYLDALKQIIRQAGTAGDGQIAAAAQLCMDDAGQMDKDRATAGADDDGPNSITFMAALHIEAATAGADGKGKVRKFSMDAYNGGAMRLKGWDFPVVVDLDGIGPLDRSSPVLRDHDAAKVVGHTTKKYVENGTLKAAGLVSGHGSHVDEVVQSADNSFPWQASIGARVVNNEFIPKGKQGLANGQTFDGPINISRKTYLGEISFVGLGADDTTSARIAAKAAKGSPMKFSAWAKARGYSADDLAKAGVMKCARASFKAEHEDGEDDSEGDEKDGKKPDEGSDDAAAKAKAKAKAKAAADLNIQASAELTPEEYQAEIRAIQVAELKRAARIAELAKNHPDIQARAIEENWSEDKVKLEVLLKDRGPAIIASNGQFGINTGKGGGINGQILAAAACMSVGMPEKNACEGLNETEGNIANSRHLRGMSLHRIISAVAPTLGIHCPAGGIDRDFLDNFLHEDRAAHRRQNNGKIEASSNSGFSTMSLTGITENIMFKAMLAPFVAFPSVIPDLAYQTDTNDFKIYKRYRLTGSGTFAPVGVTAEIATMSLQDESYPNQVSTKAVLLVLTRENIMNDDMGALTQSPELVGRQAAMTRERAFFTTFLSGLSTVAPGPSVGKTANTAYFWSTTAKNYLSGGSSALSIASLTTAMTQFMQQVDANGDPIMVMPDRLLVPPELVTVADNLFNGANLTVQALTSAAVTSGPVKAADVAAQIPNLNQHRGKYRPIMSPFLGGGAGAVSGGTATQWALLSDPSGGFATVQIGYLRGQRTPIIRQVDTDAKVLGIAYQAIYDFGIALHDFRCGQYSAGT